MDVTEVRFPDFEAIVDEVGALYRQGRLPHAVLLTSDSGLGLEGTAQMMATRLLCDCLLYKSDAADDR